MRIPNHIGIIPDGNRRWAVQNGLNKEQGYGPGLKPGVELFRLCKKIGIKELTYYGFTTDNTKRSSIQTKAFTAACIEAVKILSKEDASLLVLGNTDSPMFPKELLPFTSRKQFGKGDIRVNFLVNYGWEWDLGDVQDLNTRNRTSIMQYLKSSDVTRVDFCLFNLYIPTFILLMIIGLILNHHIFMMLLIGITSKILLLEVNFIYLLLHILINYKQLY